MRNRRVAIIIAAILAGLVISVATVFPAEPQEAELVPGDALIRNLCNIGPDVTAWLADAKDIPKANLPQRSRDELDTVAHSLDSLCADAADLNGPTVKRGFWLLRADALGQRLTGELSRILEAPQTTASRIRLQKLTVSIAYLEGTLGLLRSTYSYTRVEVREKEVIRTVEVPAQCPKPELPQQPRESPCVSVLRQGADRWSTQLYKWTVWYRGSGADWALADSSKSELNSIAHGSGDPAAYLVGWLAQWRSIRRQGSTSVLGSGPMPQIAADMRAQLAYCGMPQPDFDR